MRIFVPHDHRLPSRRHVALCRAISIKILTKHLLCLLNSCDSTFSPVMLGQLEPFIDRPRLACLQYLVDKQARSLPILSIDQLSSGFTYGCGCTGWSRLHLSPWTFGEFWRLNQHVCVRGYLRFSFQKLAINELALCMLLCKPARHTLEVWFIISAFVKLPILLTAHYLNVCRHLR